MIDTQKIQILGFPQEQYYTCGCASFRTVLNSLGLDDVDEAKLEEMLGTTHLSGTHYTSMVDIGPKFGLKVQSGTQGSLELLDDLIEDGWVVVICHSIEGPHYSVYMGSNGQHLFIYDPNVDKKVGHPVHKFVKSQWKVDISEHKFLIAEWGLKLDDSHNSDKWWVAYKK